MFTRFSLVKRPAVLQDTRVVEATVINNASVALLCSTDDLLSGCAPGAICERNGCISQGM